MTLVDGHIKNKAVRVFWLTGLAGSGKSTLGKALQSHFISQGWPVVYLDGDQLREVFGNNQDYSRQGRLELAWRYSHLCHMLATQGLNVICATISLFHEIQTWNRKHLPGYTEIVLDVPFEILLQRDPKQLYSRALKGELTEVIGVDLEPEWPLHPDLVLSCQDNPSPEILLTQLLTHFHLLGSAG